MATPVKHPEYQNNPFTIATDGISLLFNRAKPIAIVALVLVGLGLIGGAPSGFTGEYNDSMSISHPDAMAYKLHSVPVEVWIIVGIIALVIMLGFIVIGTFIAGIFDYTAARLADNKSVTLGEALKAVAARFFSYLWLQIVVAIKILLWSLLLIVPGIIMATRYSLSGPSFFRHQLGANAATKHSAAITKGAWLTTFGSFGLFNIITFGLIQAILQPGTSGLLQRQFDAYYSAKLTKPPAHALSWLTLGLVIGLFLLAIVVIVLIGLLVTYGFSEGHRL